MRFHKTGDSHILVLLAAVTALLGAPARSRGADVIWLDQLVGPMKRADSRKELGL